VKPKILGFICNWCGYGAIESITMAKQQYPTNVKLIRVLCSGKIERKLILESLLNGIDGVIIITCNFGNCHYMDGNVQCYKRVEAIKNLVQDLGIDNRRIKFQTIRASEGDKLANILTDFINEIKTLLNY